MALPNITLISPENNFMSVSQIPTFTAKYEDLETGLEASIITIEVDRFGGFNTSVKQTQSYLNVASGDEVSFIPAPALTNGYWYWRITATNADGTTTSNIWCVQISAGVLKRILYQYENIAKYGPDWTKKRALYQYENISKYVSWTRKRALYEYENITDDPPFPWIERLSLTRAAVGAIVSIYGNGFGAKYEADISNADRAARGYGGQVFIGTQLCNIVSWTWQKIDFQIPESAVTGPVKVVLNEPTVRESNVIGLEIIETHSSETGLELFICDRTNPNTIVAYLESATDKSFQSLLNTGGSGTFTISRYDLKGANRNLIRDQNYILCRVDGKDVFKWIIESREPKYVEDSEEQLIQVSGRSVMTMLEWAVVYPDGMPHPERLERSFTGYAGAILRHLLLEAQARGCLTGINIGWTEFEDTVGNKFEDLTFVQFHAGTPLSEVVTKFTEGMGLFDVVMTPDLKLNLYSKGGEDKYETVRYRPGQGILDHTNKSDATRVTNTILVEGKDGLILEAGHPTSQIEWGRREGYLQARDVTDGLSEYGQMHLNQSAIPYWGIQGKVTRFQDSKGNKIKPFETFQNGDWIGWIIPPEGSDTEGFDGKLRVKGITVEEDGETGDISYTLDLNNVILENEIRMKQKMERISMYSADSPLSSPAEEPPAGKEHTHEHGLLTGLDEDTHPQYLNEDRHSADPHIGVPRVSSICKSGDDTLTGAIELAAGTNITLTQDTVTKKITISSSGGGGGEEAINGVPIGGTTGQILSKIDSTDFNVQWIDAPSGGGGTGIVAGILLMAEDLIDILVGTGIKSLEDAFISPYMSKALLYKGSDGTTRTDTFTFTSGAGKLKIYYEYHTESISYDWGVFYLDNVQLAKFGGARDIRYLEVDIVAGMHEFKIEYRKDSSGMAGYDGIKIYAINYPEQ